MRLLSVLAFTHIVIIDRWIKSLGHGRLKIYGINGAVDISDVNMDKRTNESQEAGLKKY